MTYNKGFGAIGALLVVLGILIIGGVGYVVLKPNLQTDKVSSDAQTATEPSIRWTFEDAGERDAVAYTNVSVTVNGVAYAVGSFQGSCSEIGATGGVDGKGLLAGELSGAQCWFAGGGDEIGVFATEDGGLEILTGSLSEGIEGGDSFRGDFKIHTQIAL